jgi:hypothetical protein
VGFLGIVAIDSESSTRSMFPCADDMARSVVLEVDFARQVALARKNGLAMTALCLRAGTSPGCVAEWRRGQWFVSLDQSCSMTNFPPFPLPHLVGEVSIGRRHFSPCFAGA